MPSRNRPPESDWRLRADVASSAGLREPSCTTNVPSPIVVVWAARWASPVSASYPQTSGTHNDDTPTRSTSRRELAGAGVMGIDQGRHVHPFEDTTLGGVTLA